ncbi:MAG TPA: phosphatase PAP2 family protein [Streptosporangiaceae bacterium]|nr:phosphatase PAP2 family protein [Streptosporangiaceae bacterium]
MAQGEADREPPAASGSAQAPGGGPATADPQAVAEAVADRLADRLGRLGDPARQRLTDALHQIGAIDRAVYDAVAAVPAPALDQAMRRLSNAANHSRLWLGIAGGLALTGGPAGRRAAARGILAIGVTSAVVNLGVKSVSARRRPDRARAGVPGERHVTMPSSTSFPSGHSACAFAFATAISRDSPWLAIAIQFLAGGVAYSRVHTGVHYPGDTVAGALIGAGTGQAVSTVFDRAIARSRPAGLPAP